MARREATLAMNARFNSKTREWKISLRRGRLTAKATGIDYDKTYEAAMNALGFMVRMNNQASAMAQTLGKAPA